jgi:hypothetical protein
VLAVHRAGQTSKINAQFKHFARRQFE